MTLLVIILILLGVGIIVLSCLFVDKADSSGEAYQTLTDQRVSTIHEIEELKKKVQSILSDFAEETIIKTEDQLSQICNEKIIAVNDFSKLNLDKINQNHEEVVFLYNMLSEKENELKEFVKSIDRAKLKMTDPDKQQEEAPPPKSRQTSSKKGAAGKNSKTASKKAAQDTDNNAEPLSNHNQKILDLYSKGYSIMDIAKTLELGQGEVKLVIDLYTEK